MQKMYNLCAVSAKIWYLAIFFDRSAMAYIFLATVYITVFS